MENPYFSVVIPVYNRPDIVLRCLRSCLNQIYDDFEVIVVDDGSTDATPESLRTIADPRVTIVTHSRNRGMNPARNSGVKRACGEWRVIVDSDWALLPHALSRLHELTSRLPADIRVIGSCMRWDTGRITPQFVPPAAIDYEGRIKWVEEEGGSDFLYCIRRQVFDEVTYDPERRSGDDLFALNLALHARMLCVDDVLAIEYSDASNSITRGSSRAHMRSLRTNAPDRLWMYEETLRVHGESLQKWGPRQYRSILRRAALQSFYSGRRNSGISFMARYLRLQPSDVFAWAIMFLGVLGARPALLGHFVKRKLGV